MKAFIIICGKKAFIRYKFNIEDAITWAQNYCDQSQEIIIREVEQINLI